MTSETLLQRLREADNAACIERVEGHGGFDFKAVSPPTKTVRVIGLDGALWQIIVHGTTHGVTRWAPERGNGLLVCAKTMARLLTD